MFRTESGIKRHWIQATLFTFYTAGPRAMKSKIMLYRNLLFLSPLIFTFTLGIIFKIIFGIRSMYINVPYLHYCENNFGKLLQIMDTEDGSGSEAPTKKNVTSAGTAAAAAAAASSGTAPNLPADDAARIIAENTAAAAAARADLLKRTPPPPAALYKRIQSILRQRSVVN